MKKVFLCLALLISLLAPRGQSYALAAAQVNLGTGPTIASSGFHTCAVDVDGNVRCWGINNDGQTDVPGGLGFVTQVAVGGAHSCALNDQGQVRCWGFNGYGQTNVPSRLGRVTQIATAYYNASCAVNDQGKVRCWGTNSFGQNDIPIDIGFVTHVAVGYAHVCALQVEGTVVCWGNDEDGRTEVPSSLGKTIQISSGTGGTTCALSDTGKVTCWGTNLDGRLDAPNNFGPAKDLTAGYTHSCFINVQSNLICWGRNTQDGEASVPSDLGQVTQIAVGMSHNCAVALDGTVRCWGSNYFGQLNVPRGLRVLPVGRKFKDTPLPTISGVPTVGSTLEVSPGNWESGSQLSYQWTRDGQLIEGDSGTTHQLTSVDLYSSIAVKVTAYKEGYLPVTKISSPVLIDLGTLTTQGDPRIIGLNEVGETVRADPGTWQVGTTFSYKWFRDGSTIIGVDSDTLVLSPDDYQHNVSFSVTADNLGYKTATKVSEPQHINAGRLSGIVAPVVTGATSLGSVLSVTSSYSGLRSSYIWKRDGTATGNVGNSYTLSLNDVGTTISVSGSLGKNGYQNLTLESNGTTVSTTVPNTACSAPIDKSSWASTSGQQPTIAGIATFGSTLKGSTGSWTSGTKFCTYWFENGKAIVGALSSSYKIQANDIGSQIYYVVVGTDKQGKSVLRYSDPVSITNATLTNAVAPTMSGQIKVGSTATAFVKAWNTGVAYSYQWLRNGLPISSATNSTYAIQAADLNQNLTVKVCGSKQYFDSVCMTSTSAKIVGLGTIPTAAGVTISGASSKAGATLSGSSGNWMQGVTLQQQWLLDGNPIPNATGSTYVVQASDKGHTISFQVTASAAGYQTVVKTSIGRKIS